MSILHVVKGGALLIPPLLLTILFSAEVYAACPRDDVTYYLQQGFNHQQIVKLCSDSKNAHQKPFTSLSKPQQNALLPQVEQQPNPLASAPIIRHEVSGIYGNPDAIFLATAIEVYDVEVTKNTIIFTRKDCFTYGQEDWNQFKNSACPTVKYTIVRGGLKIMERDNGFFSLSGTSLYISGNIRADILDLSQFKQDHQQEIRRIIQENTKKLKIDVRRGMPQNKVEAIFLKLAG